MAEPQNAAACTHACQNACGRQYDIISIQVVDGSSNFHCLPCFIAFSVQVATAMLEPDNADVQAVVELNPAGDVVYVDASADGIPIRGFSDPIEEDEFDIVEVVGE